jgi:dethiobiotin synthetase
VGKTALSRALVYWARARGLRPAYLKPVQCGRYRFGDPLREGGDADWVRALAGGDVPSQVTYTLRMPASPHLAAEREGLRIDPARIREDIGTLAAACDLLVVEGSGGAAVPLDRQGSTLAALASEMRIPALIACAPGLGTLHHTLATQAFLNALNAPLAGFAFCHREIGAASAAGSDFAAASAPSAASTGFSSASLAETLFRDNRETLEALTRLPCFGSLAFSDWAARGTRPVFATAEAWFSPIAARMDAWWNRDAATGTRAA